MISALAEWWNSQVGLGGGLTAQSRVVHDADVGFRWQVRLLLKSTTVCQTNQNRIVIGPLIDQLGVSVHQGPGFISVHEAQEFN